MVGGILTLLQDPLCGSGFHSRPGPKADLEGARAFGAAGWTGIGAWVMAFCSWFWPRAGGCTGLLVRNAPMV